MKFCTRDFHNILRDVCEFLESFQIYFIPLNDYERTLNIMLIFYILFLISDEILYERFSQYFMRCLWIPYKWIYYKPHFTYGQRIYIPTFHTYFSSRK
jgi:hypothetical protein